MCEGSVGDNKGGSPCMLVFSGSGSLDATKGTSAVIRTFFGGGETGPMSKALDSFVSEITSIDLVRISYKNAVTKNQRYLPLVACFFLWLHGL